MADAKNKKGAAPAKGAKAGGKDGKQGTMTAHQRRSNAAVTMIMSVVVILAAVLPTACILVPGMLPTLCALIGDRDKEKAAGITVGAMNAAGVAQMVIELWKRGHDFDTAFTLLTQPGNWLIMYGAAAMGWMIYFIVPTIVASFMTAGSETRLQTLRNNLEELKRIWGPDVGQ